MQLPKTACLNPSPSYYAQFNGYTLGLLLTLVFMALLYFLGSQVLARITLRGMTEEERATRRAAFNSTMLARALLLLYLARCCACVLRACAMATHACPTDRFTPA